jgi:hypothetical protein
VTNLSAFEAWTAPHDGRAFRTALGKLDEARAPSVALLRLTIRAMPGTMGHRLHVVRMKVDVATGTARPSLRRRCQINVEL